MAPVAPSGAVFDPCFHTAAGSLEAGTAFALEVPPLGVLLVTCQHLFGPAGGLSKDVPPSLMGQFVQSVSLTGAFVFGASAPHPSENGTQGIIFEDSEIHLPGTSGAPVLAEDGALVGMVVRFRLGSGVVVGFLLPASQLRSQLLAAKLPTPPKRGFFQRLFG